MKTFRWIIVAVMMATLVCILVGCGTRSDSGDAAGQTPAAKQTAAAKQQVGEKQEALMTVELTGGYSVEFASGAAYFYEGEPSDENEAIAFGYVITKAEYDEEVSYLTADSFEDKDKVKELGDGVYSYDGQYFYPSEDGFYIKVAVQAAGLEDAEAIYPRFKASKVE